MPARTLDAPALSALAAFCGSYASGRHGATRRFLPISGRAFVRTGSRSLFLARHWRRFSGSGKWNALRVLLPAQGGTDLPCDFDLVYRKTELRLFDFIEGSSIKVFLEAEPGSGRNARGEELSACLRREVEGRRMAARAGIAAPAILAHGLDPIPFLKETWVPGRLFPRAPDPEDAWSQGALSVLADLQRSHPPRLAFARDVPSLMACAGLAASGGKADGNPHGTPRPALAAFLHEHAAAYAPDAPALIGEVHGDFVPANLVRTPRGGVCVLDWETCGPGVFGYDLQTYLGHCRLSGWTASAQAAIAGLADRCGGTAAPALEGLADLLAASREACLRHCAIQAVLSFIGSRAGSGNADETAIHLDRCAAGVSAS